MASRIRTLTAAVASLINAHASLPAGITAERVRSVTFLTVGLPTATPGRIAVLCKTTEDASDRAGVAETITLSVVLVVRCSAEAVAASDAYEDFLETLADTMRQSTTYKTLSLAGNIAAQRRSVQIVTPGDAQILDEQEMFFGVIEAAYYVSVGAVA
jgi:hypothetical protein